MATKYAGQNALNKLMQIVKTALASKADKTNATTSAAGLMSASDKTKLDGIAAGATKITVDSELSSSSANPVMNGTITAKLVDKADKSDLSGKLDKAGGTITGNLIVSGDFEPAKGLTTNGGVNAQSVSTPVLALHDNGTAGANACINVAGADAVEVTVPDGEKRAKARLKIGTPTEDDDATTKAYVDGLAAEHEAITVTSTKVSDLGYDASNGASRYSVAFDASFDSILANLASNKPMKFNITLPDSTGGFPVSFSTGYVSALNDSGYLFTGTILNYPVVLSIGALGSATVELFGAYMPDPNPDDSDDGKSLVVNGHKWVMKKAAVDDAMSDTSTNPAQNKVVKSYVDTKVSGLQTASQVKAAINSALTGVYTPRGSISFANLPQPQEGNKGYVYNVTNDFTTTSAFLEGAGRAYSAGTNVACVYAGSDNGYKWDVLAGTIDLTELTANEVQTLWDSI